MTEFTTIHAGTPEAQALAADQVLQQVEAYLRRFVWFPSDHARVAATLWVAHTYLIDDFESTPRLALLSPEPGSGKTRALEVIGSLVRYPMHAINCTPAALFRSVADLDNRPTILFDEIDTVFGPKARDNEEVRGFLNAGHRRSGVAYRCVGMGTAQKVMAFPSFCAVALAGLNDIPDTIASRAIIIRMRRRGPGENSSRIAFVCTKPKAWPSAARWRPRCPDSSYRRSLICREGSRTGPRTCGNPCWRSRKPQAASGQSAPHSPALTWSSRPQRASRR